MRLITRVSHISLLVRDQDEALRWYMEKLGFEKVEDDSKTVPGYRWLTVAPKGRRDLEIILHKPRSKEAEASIGRQPGTPGQPETYWILQADNCRKTYEELRTKGVKVLGEPAERPYGVEVGFEDLYGNVFWIIEPREEASTQKENVTIEA